MGENLDLPEREAIRTPMQWDDTRNAGFSRADPERLQAPVISEGPLGYQRVNVTAQRRDPHGLLVWFERILNTRRECEEIGSGHHEVIDAGPSNVLVHRATGDHGVMLFLHNLADRPARSTSASSPTSRAGRSTSPPTATTAPSSTSRRCGSTTTVIAGSGCATSPDLR